MFFYREYFVFDRFATLFMARESKVAHTYDLKINLMCFHKTQNIVLN